MALKQAIITGGNVGIGLNAAHKLAARGGYAITLAVRTVAKGEAAAAAIRAAHPSADVSIMACDLSSLASVREFAAAYRAKHSALHLLILNAGCFAGTGSTPSLTADGLELTFGTNHVGGFLLTSLLLPALRAGAPSRVVVTSSELHEKGRFARRRDAPAAAVGADAAHAYNWQLLRLDAPTGKPSIIANSSAKQPAQGPVSDGYGGMQAYKNSKLANVLFARELHRREVAAGSGVTITAIHPGFIPSSELLRTVGSFGHGVLRKVVQPIGRLFGFVQTLDDGGDATMAGAFAEVSASDPEGSKFFVVRNEHPSSAASRDPHLAAALWAYTEGLITACGGTTAAEAPVVAPVDATAATAAQ